MTGFGSPHAPGDRGKTSAPSFLLATTVVIVGSLVLGGLTSFGQGLLPAALQSFANSVSGWTLVTGVLVWIVRRPLAQSALLGAASFVLLVLGYTTVSNLRGFYFSPIFWSVAGLVAGPAVGASAAALRRSDRWGAVGLGVLAGVLLGDSWFGLTTVAATTGRAYWTVVGLLGAVLLVVVSVVRLRTARLGALAGSVTVAVGLSLNGFYAFLSFGALGSA